MKQVAPERFRSFAIAAALLGCLPAIAAAQGAVPVNPGNVQTAAEQTQAYYLLQQKMNQGAPAPPNLSVQNPSAPSSAAAAASSATFVLQRVITGPSAWLKPQEIAAIARHYENKQVSIADLLAMLADINHLYSSKGVATARAYLPAQTVQDGIVHVELIEARLGKVVAENVGHTRPSFIGSQLSAGPGQLLNIPALQSDLLRLNATSGLNLHALLAPGQEAGSTDLLLVSDSPDDVVVAPFFDNAGRDTIGRNRVGLNDTTTNLLGIQDRLTLGVFWAEGTLADTISYSVPIDGGGSRLVVGDQRSGIAIRGGPLKTLSLAGNSSDSSLALSQPLIAAPRLTVINTYGYHRKISIFDSLGFLLGDTTENTAQIGTDLRWFAAGGALYLSNNLVFGQAYNATRSGFGLDNFSATEMIPLSAGIVEILRLQGQKQLTGIGDLPQQEQLQLGGATTIHGYGQGWVIGNEGYAAGVETDLPIPTLSSVWSQRLHGAVFADEGAGYGLPGPHSGPEAVPNSVFLDSAGAGLVVRAKYFNARVDMAVPLQDRTGLPKVGFDFYVQPTLPVSRLMSQWFSPSRPTAFSAGYKAQ